MENKSFSISIVGDGAIGKSTIINSFKTNGFNKIYQQTIGCDFYEKNIEIKNKYNISLRIWDIGGQSLSSKNFLSYIQNSSCIFLCYDLTNYNSFLNLNDWLSKIIEIKQQQIHNNKSNNNTNNEQTLIYLIGNKIDLYDLRQVTNDKHLEFIQEFNLNNKYSNILLYNGGYCSAKTGENIIKLFYKIAGQVVGVRFTEEELQEYENVVKAVVVKGYEDERTEWADEIEKEDMERERRKQEGGCCLIS